MERKHIHLLEAARAIKFQGHLPHRFWGECVEAATYIINRIPLSVLGNMSRYEIMYNKQPNLSHIRVVECLAFATNLRRDNKFAPKARKIVFLGYAINKKGYTLLDIESKVIFVSRDVIFHETEFPCQFLGLNKDDDHELSVFFFHEGDSELTPCVVLRSAVTTNVTECTGPFLCTNDEYTGESTTDVGVFSEDPVLPYVPVVRNLR